MDMTTLVARLPEPINGLGHLAYNLWWSWHTPARDLFRALDLRAWRESEHNPVEMLEMLPEDVLKSAAADPDFLRNYREVMKQFEAETASRDGWFPKEHGDLRSPLAFLSAEYGLHESLPLYAGGLGVLAGDYLKECSDLAMPVVAVGLIYSRSYGTQRIQQNGLPEDVDETLDRSHDPITQVLDSDGKPLIVQMPLFNPPVHVTVWRASVGTVALYLLDTDIPQNQPWDQAIAHHLYATNLEQRLRQEIVLGMGGIRVLEAMGIRPAALHINEGHPAFAILERIRTLVKEGATFEEAERQVRETTIFTTHTPVPAGTDVFPFQLMDKYFSSYYSELACDHDAFMKRGVLPERSGDGFNMTAFALRMAQYRNAVSKRHGEVARKMWASLWPEKSEADVPIQVITNGVHIPSWIEPVRLQPLFAQYLGRDWLAEQDQAKIWERVDDIPDETLWNLHRDLRGRLVAEINEQSRARWQRDKIAGSSVIALGALLDPEILTLGFARRFTAYKRPDLILTDLERLKRLLTDPWHPLQIVFAGKAHPADQEGQRLIQKVFSLAQDPDCAGRIAFVEDYDQHLAEYLVHGVDVWLNNPLPPLEASGTSGMKASVNGAPNLSILDGWWIEGYDGTNGWAFGADAPEGDRTLSDANAVYELLERQILPMFYERSDDQIPHDFVKIMKAAIKTVAPQFSTRRMVKDYVNLFYVNALGDTVKKTEK